MKRWREGCSAQTIPGHHLLLAPAQEGEGSSAAVSSTKHGDSLSTRHRGPPHGKLAACNASRRLAAPRGGWPQYPCDLGKKSSVLREQSVMLQKSVTNNPLITFEASRQWLLSLYVPTLQSGHNAGYRICLQSGHFKWGPSQKSSIYGLASCPEAAAIFRQDVEEIL